MYELHLEIEGQVEFSRRFTRFTEYLTDMRQLAPGIVAELRQSLDEQFDSEGAAGRSGAWDGLSKSYARWKARHYPGKPINQRTQKLRNALTGNTSDTIYEATPDSITFGTRLRYGKHVQKRRKVIDLSERQKTRLMKTIQRRLLQAGRDAGFTLG